MAKRTLLVSLQGLGNALLALSAAKELRAADDEVTLLTLSPRLLPVLSHVPFLHGVIAADDPEYRRGTRRLRLLLELRRRRFDRAIFSFPSGINAQRFIRATGIPERIGHRYSPNNSAARHLTTAVVPLRNGHDLEQNRQLIGVPLEPPLPWPVLTIPPRLIERARAYLASHHLDPQARYVGLHTGCDGHWIAKRWPEAHFATLAEGLYEKYNLHAIVFDGPAEPGSGLKVARLAKSPVHALGGYGDLADAWGLLGVCDVFVANDSGLMNLASASGLPTVAIFGPSEPHRTRPFGPRGRAVVSDRSCAPCFGLGPYAGCPFPNDSCMAELPPHRVLATVDELMAR